MDASEEIDLSGFESTSHAPVEETLGSTETIQAEGFETTSVVETSPASPKALPKQPPSESFDEMMIDLDEELVESTLEKTAAPVQPAPASKSVTSPPTDLATAWCLVRRL